MLMRSLILLLFLFAEAVAQPVSGLQGNITPQGAVTITGTIPAAIPPVPPVAPAPPHLAHGPHVGPPIERVADFINRIGVVPKLYEGGVYANVANVIADIKYLGINQIRDIIQTWSGGIAPMEQVCRAGIKVTGIVNGVNFTTGNPGDDLTTVLQAAAYLNKNAPGCVEALEGHNEINNMCNPVAQCAYNGITDPLSAQIALQRDLYAYAKNFPFFNPGIDIYYLTGWAYVSGSPGPNPFTTPGLADYNNQHPYPVSPQPPGGYIDPRYSLCNSAATFPGNELATNCGPFVYTEIGYQSTLSNAHVQAVYTLEIMLDCKLYGAHKCFIYQLIDDGDSYALFDATNAPKAAATAVHNLTMILADAGATAKTFAPSPLAYTVTSALAIYEQTAVNPGGFNTILLQDSKGAWYIAVWNEQALWNTATSAEIVPAYTPVTINLPTTAATVTVYDPVVGTVVSAMSGVASAVLSLGANPLIVKVQP